MTNTTSTPDRRRRIVIAPFFLTIGLGVFLISSTASAISSNFYDGVTMSNVINGTITTSSCSNPARGNGYYTDIYRVSGSPSSISLYMEGGGLGDPYLQILSGDRSTIIVQNDDGGVSLDAFLENAPIATTYLIMATTFRSGATGSYILYSNEPLTRVTECPQAITFELSGTRQYGTDFNVSASTSENLAPSFSVDTPGVCEVTGTSFTPPNATATVRPLSTGACTLTATQSGSGSTGAALPVSRTVTITQKPLTVNGLTATKEYDGTTSLPVTGTATLTGAVPGDDVALSGTPSVSSPADVGVRTLTITGLSLSGSHSGRYALAPPTLQTSVTPRTLTLSGTRVYDGTTTVAASALTISEGLVSGQALTLAGSGTVSSPDATSSTSLTASGLTLGNGVGGSATNYTLAGGSHTVAITQRPVTVSGSRIYDGTTTASTSDLTVDGLVTDEDLTLSGTGTIPTADVEAAPHPVTGITLSDGTAGLVANYALTSSTLTVTARPVRGAFTATGRVYDATTSLDDALVSGRTLGAIDGTPASGVVAVDGVLDDVVLDGGVATLAAAAADESTPTTVTLSGATLAGSRAANYTLQSVDTTTATISRRPVTVSGTFTAQDRQYDGSASASIDANGLSLVDTIGADDVTLVPVVAFATPDVGDGRAVGLTGASTLTGAAAANYRLELTGAPTATADITPRALTVASGSFTVADKVYDGTDVATVSSNDLALTGFATGDSSSDVTWEPTGSFTDTTAGTSRTVDLAGGAVIQGLKGANYVLDVTGAPTATASITRRPVTVTGASAAARPYDGTTAVVVSGASLANTVAGDAVSLANATSGVAASRNAGTQGVSTSTTLSGADAANYRLAGQPSLSVTITPLPVDVTMNALPSRAYDGSSALPLSPGAFSVTGVLAGESIAVSGTGQLSSRAAGTRTVTVTPTFTPAGGTELVNYTLPTSVSGTVTVTPLPLRVVGAAVTSRVWDGSTAATISGATLEGVRAGDAVSLTAASSGTFASAQPGTHAARFTPTLVGVDAANYTLSVPELSGTITRAPASLRLTGGLTQFADGSPRTVRAAVSPAGAGRVVVTYGGGGAPTAPGSYPASVTLDSSTHEASSLSATLTVQPVEDLLDVLGPAADPDAGPDADRGTVEERRAAVLARIAVHSDGTRAYPEIGPVLAEDGTAPALIPNDRRVLSDGEPVESRVSVVEDERVRVESDGGFAIELTAAIGDGEDRVTLPVDADGTLLLDRGGFVDVGGSGFRPGSTAEVWMFSTVTFLGTAIVDADGGFAGSFPIDELLEAGEHTIQLNGVGADEQVRSTSLGVRVDDPENSARERIAFASERGEGAGITSGPVWLILLAALLGAATTRWWIVGRRRRDDEDAAADELVEVTRER